MKKLSKIDLDLMEKELPLLDKSSLGVVKGGYSPLDGNCFFNCMEYVGKGYGFNADYSFYNKTYSSFYGDPLKPGSDGIVGVSTKYMGDFYSNFYGGYNEVKTGITNDSFDGTQIMMFKPAGAPDGYYHAAIPMGTTSDGKILYYDPTLEARGQNPIQMVDPTYVIGIIEPDLNASGFIPGYKSMVSGIMSGTYDYPSGGF